MEKDPLLSTVRRGTGTDVEESPFVDQLYATSEPRPRRRAILAAGINIARLILVLLLLVFVADKIWNYVEDEGASTTNLTDDLLEDSGDSGIEISATDDGGDDGSCGYARAALLPAAGCASLLSTTLRRHSQLLRRLGTGLKLARP